jgi:tripartite-type tricarboxylate transporter receptor subunit TctC
MKPSVLSHMMLTMALTLGASMGLHAAEPPTTLIVGFQAGGGLDSVARALANVLNQEGGHKVVVENKPGASGMIAIDAVRNAKAGDSVLVIMPSSSISMTPHTNKHFKYDPERDLAPVARIATYTLGIATPTKNGIADLPDFINQAKQSPKLAAYGTAGIGLSPHYTGEVIATQSNVDLTHVPYKGAGPAINDAVGGQVPAVIATVPALLPFVRDGRLKLLATTGSDRDTSVPEAPTLKELGYKGLEIEEWFGILAPAKTAPDVVQQWNTAINQALASTTLREALSVQGFTPAPMSADAFRHQVLTDYDMWREALKDTGDTFLN